MKFEEECLGLCRHGKFVSMVHDYYKAWCHQIDDDAIIPIVFPSSCVMIMTCNFINTVTASRENKLFLTILNVRPNKNNSMFNFVLHSQIFDLISRINSPELVKSLFIITTTIIMFYRN